MYRYLDMFLTGGMFAFIFVGLFSFLGEVAAITAIGFAVGIILVHLSYKEDK